MEFLCKVNGVFLKHAMCFVARRRQLCVFLNTMQRDIHRPENSSGMMVPIGMIIIKKKKKITSGSIIIKCKYIILFPTTMRSIVLVDSFALINYCF